MSSESDVKPALKLRTNSRTLNKRKGPKPHPGAGTKQNATRNLPPDRASGYMLAPPTEQAQARASAPDRCAQVRVTVTVPRAEAEDRGARGRGRNEQLVCRSDYRIVHGEGNGKTRANKRIGGCVSKSRKQRGPRRASRGDALGLREGVWTACPVRRKHSGY